MTTCDRCPWPGTECRWRQQGRCLDGPHAFPDCAQRGPQIESGAGCGCGPKHLCKRDTKIVSAADCRACVAGDTGKA